LVPIQAYKTAFDSLCQWLVVGDGKFELGSLSVGLGEEVSAEGSRLNEKSLDTDGSEFLRKGFDGIYIG
jgi:hypothetical protein